MPTKPRFKLPALNHRESMGERLARLRQARGLTQIAFAARIGITQSLLSSYECDRLKLSAEMAIHFTQALKVSADELLGLKPMKGNGEGRLSLKLTRRLKGIEQLPPGQQRVLLKTIDQFLKGAGK